MIATIGRSLGHQLMPVKYCMEVPASNINASILCSVSSRCAFFIRASLSFTVMGSASLVIGCGIPPANPDCFVCASDWREFIPTIPVAAARAERLIKSLLLSVIQNN
jgi:hypothetical protein